MPDDVLAHVGLFAAGWVLLAVIVAAAVAMLMRGGARREHDDPADEDEDAPVAMRQIGRKFARLA
jgi:hypothetical protein